MRNNHSKNGLQTLVFSAILPDTLNLVSPCIITSLCLNTAKALEQTVMVTVFLNKIGKRAISAHPICSQEGPLDFYVVVLFAFNIYDIVRT